MFLGISLEPGFRISPAAARRVAAIETVLPGRRRQTWRVPALDTTSLMLWERDDGLGSEVDIDSTKAMMTVGFGDVGIGSHITADLTVVTAGADPLGYGTVFTWGGDGIAAISTRPELLVALADAVGQPVTKDPATAEDLAYIGWRRPTDTGWSQISALEGDHVAVSTNGVIRIEPSAPGTAWLPSDSDPASLDDLVTRAADALTGNVTRILASDRPITVDLTAGRDSRMVLAAIIAIGARHDVTFQTIGGADLHDVRTAQALTDRLGATHRHGYFLPLPTGTLAERLRGHVALTAGMANPKDGLRDPFAPIAEVRMSGLVGETLRGWRTAVSREKPAATVVDRIAKSFGAGRLDLLRPEAAERAAERVRHDILDSPNGEPNVAGWHVAHRYYCQARLRSRMSRVDDMTAEARAYPLYSPELLDIGIEAMWHHPEADLATAMIERLAPGLDSLVPAAEPSEVKAPSLMRVVAAQQVDERQTMFASLASTDSAAWESIDHRCYTTAVDEYDRLKNTELGLLNAAAAAILWLGSASVNTR